MAIVRERELFTLAERGFERSGGALVYGTDGDAIAVTARVVQENWPGGEVTTLEASTIRNQEGVLLDLLASQSLFAGRRLVVIEGADEQHASSLAPAIGVVHANAFLVVAGSLRKDSKLRREAEDTASCAVLALHEETASVQLARLLRESSDLGFAFAPGAAERLLELCGGNRGLIAAEMCKLSLLGIDMDQITASTVEEICGDPSETDFNSLIQSLLESKLSDTDTALARVLETGEFASLLPLLQNHLARLSIVRAALDDGLPWDVAFKKPKPVIYFGQQEQTRKQLAGMTLEDLHRLQRRVQQIALQSRRLAANGDLAAAQALFMETVKRSGLLSGSR